MGLNKFSLEGKKVLITGASSGIGKQTAIEASQMGAELFITGRNKERLNETHTLCKKGNHKTISADLTNHDELMSVINNIDSKIDGVVHCAGSVEYMPCSFINEKTVLEMMEINFKTSVLITSYLLRKKKLNKMASIVFLSSIASTKPYFGGSLYSSSKALKFLLNI